MQHTYRLFGVMACAAAVACGGGSDSTSNSPATGGSAGSSGSGGSGTGGASGGAGGEGATGGTGALAGAGGATGGAAGSDAGGAGGVGGAGGAGTCPTGYTGDNCSDCDVGYVEDGSGGCVDVCEGVYCERGSCVHDSADRPVCECEPGYTGDRCDACAAGYKPEVTQIGEPISCTLDEPPTNNMLAWLDADDDASFVIENGAVKGWHTRYPQDIVPYGAPTTSARPTRSRAARNARAWVSFDGVDDQLRHVVDLRELNYQIFVVAQNTSSKTVVLLSGTDTTSDYLQLHLRATSSTLRLDHFTPGTFTSDTVTLGSYPTDVPFLAEGVRRGSALIKNLGLWDGSSYELDGTLDSPVFANTTMLSIGKADVSGAGSALAGKIGEIIVFAGSGGLADNQKVRDYLAAKWNL